MNEEKDFTLIGIGLVLLGLGSMNLFMDNINYALMLLGIYAIILNILEFSSKDVEIEFKNTYKILIALTICSTLVLITLIIFLPQTINSIIKLMNYMGGKGEYI